MDINTNINRDNILAGQQQSGIGEGFKGNTQHVPANLADRSMDQKKRFDAAEAALEKKMRELAGAPASQQSTQPGAPVQVPGADMSAAPATPQTPQGTPEPTAGTSPISAGTLSSMMASGPVGEHIESDDQQPGSAVLPGQLRQMVADGPVGEHVEEITPEVQGSNNELESADLNDIDVALEMVDKYGQAVVDAERARRKKSSPVRQTSVKATPKPPAPAPEEELSDRAAKMLARNREIANELLSYTGKLTLAYIKKTYHVGSVRAGQIRDMVNEMRYEAVPKRGEAPDVTAEEVEPASTEYPMPWDEPEPAVSSTPQPAAQVAPISADRLSNMMGDSEVGPYEEPAAPYEEPATPYEEPITPEQPQDTQEPEQETDDRPLDIPSYKAQKLSPQRYLSFITADLEMPAYGDLGWIAENNDNQLTIKDIVLDAECGVDDAAALWRLYADEGHIYPDGSIRTISRREAREVIENVTNALISKYKSLGYETDKNLPELRKALEYSGAIHREIVQKYISESDLHTELGIDESRAHYIGNLLACIPSAIVSDIKPNPTLADIRAYVNKSDGKQPSKAETAPAQQPAQEQQAQQPPQEEAQQQQGQQQQQQQQQGQQQQQQQTPPPAEKPEQGQQQQQKQKTDEDKAKEDSFRAALKAFEQVFTGVRLTTEKTDEAIEKAVFEFGKLNEEVKRDVTSLRKLNRTPVEELNEFDYDADEARQKVEDKALLARMGTRRVFNNPTLLNIQGREVTVDQTRGGRFARIIYNNQPHNRVHRVIESIKKRFNIYTTDVIRTAFVASAISPALDQKVAGQKNIEDFEITADQFVELGRNIEYSVQGKCLLWAGADTSIIHPFRNIGYRNDASKNNVRNNDGFLMIAGEPRVMPGYVPKRILESLVYDENSIMYGQDIAKIQREIMREWLEFGLPYIIRSGNLDKKVALENLMIAWMEEDGIDPADAGLGELRDYQTLSGIRCEEASINPDDEQLMGPVRHRKDLIDRNLKRQWMRFNKPLDKSNKLSMDSSVEDVFNTPSKGRRTEIGYFFRCMSGSTLVAKACNLFIIATSPIESAIADGVQKGALMLSNATLDKRHHEVAEAYKYNDKLKEIANTPQWRESLSVLNKLYRTGGWGLVEAFMTEWMAPGNSGMEKDRNRFTQSDLNDFLMRWNVAQGSANTLSEWIAEKCNIDLNKPGVLYNIRKIFNSADNVLLGSGLSETIQGRLLMQLILNEMAKAEIAGNEAYNSDTLIQFARGGDNPENLLYSALNVKAGQEAYMTLGMGGLGRKTVAQRAFNKALQKNGGVTFAFRVMFTRFIEYALAKATLLVPMSNTLAYLSMYSINSYGDALAQLNDAGPDHLTARAWQYTIGSRGDFFDGLRKNLLYDAIMGIGRGALAVVIMLVCKAMHIHPPEEEENLFTLSEWVIGDGEDATPIRLAWWMDDLVGVSGPLGMALAIASYGEDIYYGDRTEDQGGEGDQYLKYDPMDVAIAAFQNALVTFNGANFLLDTFEVLNTYEADLERLTNGDYGDWSTSPSDRLAAAVEWQIWDVLGDMTPTVIGQIFPMISKDSLWYTSDDDDRSASRIYDPDYDINDAVQQYRTEYVSSYIEFSRRRQAQTNILMGLLLDTINILKPGRQTGYLFGEQPVDTFASPEQFARFSQFYLDPYDPTLPTGDRAARAVEIANRAEEVDQYIRTHYATPEEAVLDGFVLNSDMRVACIWHCIAEQEAIYDYYQQIIDSQHWPSATYHAICDERDAHLEEYSHLLNDYYLNDDIPWLVPRYSVQMSDRETRYVTEDGHPATYLDYLRGAAVRESYRYGAHNFMPWQSPNPEDTYFNYEPPIWNIRLDENGNAVNDLDAIYDWTEEIGPVTMGRFEGKDVHELIYGGQGTNSYGGRDEALALGPNDIPTVGVRAVRPLEATVPDAMRTWDLETAAGYLGLDPDSIPEPDTTGTTGHRRTAAGPLSDSSDLSPFGTTLDINYGPLAGSLVSVEDRPFDPAAIVLDTLGGIRHGVENYIIGVPASRRPYTPANGTYGADGDKVWVPGEESDGSDSDGWGGSRYGYGFRRYRYTGGYSGSGGYNYNPKIYSVDQDVNSPYAKSLGNGHQPYRATTTYLRPEFKTRGSSRPYSR